MAVYTKLTQSDISSHLSNYNIGKLIEFKEIIEGIDNSNFLLITENGKFILTIFESRINKNELQFFINFKLHLARKGVFCPQPVLDNHGFAVVDLCGKKSAIVSFLSGVALKPQEDGCYANITAKHCAAVGRAAAQMHLAAQDFKMQRQNDLGVKGLRPLFSKIAPLLDDYQKNLQQEILEEINFLESSWNHNLPSAVAHLDLFPDNIFFTEAQKVSGIIDFYFAANDALAYDFAVLVNAWCFDEKNNFSEEKFLALMNGYEKLRKFSIVEKDFFKIALRAAAMRFLLTRLHDQFFTPKNSLVKIKNPQEYLAKLKFFQTK